MEGYGISTYGDAIADIYDEWHSARLDPTAAVELLAELAGDGRALELGIGTGRVALPLAARGVAVSGIDASQAMVERLREKPGGRDIPVSFGDLADVDVEGQYSLIYIPFTTFFALPTQDDQLRCLRNVAAHLEPGGAFVMDAFVPDLARFRGNQSVAVRDVRVDRVLFDVSRHDPVTQRIEGSHIVIASDGARLLPLVVRYAWPAELDVMARLAGLELHARYGSYDRQPFDAESKQHVSVYRRPLG